MSYAGVTKEMCDHVTQAVRLKGVEFDRVFIIAPDIIFYKDNVEVHRHRVIDTGNYEPGKIAVLDHGYVQHIEAWGSDRLIIESARMSTSGAFNGWGDANSPGDEKLLKYLWNNKHSTPFEMCGLTIEVKAPLFVFREWHRHRTQGYSEMSARYVPLPDENYTPTIERIVMGSQTAGTNRQAQGAVPLDEDLVPVWLDALQAAYRSAQYAYDLGIEYGIPKELARLSVPVARYSRMRATANLRNWLAFCQLRDTKHAPGAQYEIKQFADAVGVILAKEFPRTWELFNA